MQNERSGSVLRREAATEGGAGDGAGPQWCKRKRRTWAREGERDDEKCARETNGDIEGQESDISMACRPAEHFDNWQNCWEKEETFSSYLHSEFIDTVTCQWLRRDSLRSLFPTSLLLLPPCLFFFFFKHEESSVGTGRFEKIGRLFCLIISQSTLQKAPESTQMLPGAVQRRLTDRGKHAVQKTSTRLVWYPLK